VTKREVDRIARETLAADCGCATELLGSQSVAIIHASPRGGRRYQPARALMITAYGAGAVVACSDAHFEWAYENLMKRFATLSILAVATALTINLLSTPALTSCE
jgi:hypothetical protein